MKLVYSITDLDAANIALHQQGRDRFAVTYGQQIERDLDYTTAAAKMGQAIMHALACEGKLDNRDKGEK